MQSNRAAGRRRSGGSGGAPYRSRRRGTAHRSRTRGAVSSSTPATFLLWTVGRWLGRRDWPAVSATRNAAAPWAARGTCGSSAGGRRRSGSEAGEHAARRGCLAHAHPEQSLPAHNQPADPGRRDAKAAAGVPSSPPACRNDPRAGSCAPNLTDLLRVPAPHHHRGDADRPERDVRPGRCHCHRSRLTWPKTCSVWMDNLRW